jgi:hypothetical protein
MAWAPDERRAVAQSARRQSLVAGIISKCAEDWLLLWCARDSEMGNESCYQGSSASFQLEPPDWGDDILINMEFPVDVTWSR